jgi:hypothetical protein
VTYDLAAAKSKTRSCGADGGKPAAFPDHPRQARNQSEQNAAGLYRLTESSDIFEGWNERPDGDFTA